MKAFLIDVAAQEIRAAEYAGLADLQSMVGGSICTGKTWDSGDVLFVDDDGLFKPQRHLFQITGNPQPLAGNGVVVGRGTLRRRGRLSRHR